MLKSTKSKRFLKYTAIGFVGIFALYSGGIIDAFAGFLRTGGWKMFIPVSNPNTIQYGYGFGDNGWEFGTGYGLASTGYDATTIKNAPKYNSGNVTNLQSNQTWAAPTTSITGTSTTPKEVVLPSSGLSSTVITIATGTTSDVKLNVTKILSASGINKIATLPAVTIDTSVADIQIPANTVVKGNSTWTGGIAAPKVTNVTLPSDSTTVRSLSTAINVGIVGQNLTFSNPVKIVIPNQSGKKAGYIPEGGSFIEITLTCNSTTNPTNIVGYGECKIDVGTDLVVFTKHFTTFVAFTSSTSSGGGGGGSSYAGGGSFHLVMDKCPRGDYSSSYYDRTCGVAPTKTSTTKTQTKTTKDEVIDDFINIIKEGTDELESSTGSKTETIDMGKTETKGFSIFYTAPNGKRYQIDKTAMGYGFMSKSGFKEYKTFGDAVNYIYDNNQVQKVIKVSKPKKLINTPIKPKKIVKSKIKQQVAKKEKTIVHMAPNKKVFVIREVNNKCYNVGLEKTAFTTLFEALQYIDKNNK